jgi:hypothetical protein
LRAEWSILAASLRGGQGDFDGGRIFVQGGRWSSGAVYSLVKRSAAGSHDLVRKGSHTVDRAL